MNKPLIIIKHILYLTAAIIFMSCDKSEEPVVRQDLLAEEEILGSLDSIANPEDVLDIISNDTLKIAVVHHISRNNSGGNAAVSVQRILKIMGDINANFESAKIKFLTKSIKFVDNSQWNDQFVKQDDFTTKKVLAPFEDAAALNLFYFKTLLNRSNGEITGSLGATALFPNQGNNVKLSESSVALENTATITHEIGHYLGLYHTDDDFRDNQGRIELVDGSNCTEAGDKICDTPASPRLTNSNVDESTCEYIGTETDPAGVRYSPDTFNFMTSSGRTRRDADGLCRRRFSQGQIAKMVSVLNNERSYLITRE